MVYVRLMIFSFDKQQQQKDDQTNKIKIASFVLFFIDINFRTI